MFVEALALQTVATRADAVRALPTYCQSLTGSMILASAWASICNAPKPILSKTNADCLRAYFACVRKQGMASSVGTMPPGGSFACDDGLKKCQTP